MDFIVSTLQRSPELAIFASLAIGYWIGVIKLGSFSLGTVTGTLLVAILIGQLGIVVSPNVKSIFFIMFLFAVGYGVGPQFVRGIATDGLPQAIFAVVIRRFVSCRSMWRPRSRGMTRGSAQAFWRVVKLFLRPWVSPPTRSAGLAWRPTRPRN